MPIWRVHSCCTIAFIRIGDCGCFCKSPVSHNCQLPRRKTAAEPCSFKKPYVCAVISSVVSPVCVLTYCFFAHTHTHERFAQIFAFHPAISPPLRVIDTSLNLWEGDVVKGGSWWSGSEFYLPTWKPPTFAVLFKKENCTPLGWRYNELAQPPSAAWKVNGLLMNSFWFPVAWVVQCKHTVLFTL